MDNDNYFKNKYYKYKRKYFILKQTGGALKTKEEMIDILNGYFTNGVSGKSIEIYIVCAAPFDSGRKSKYLCINRENKLSAELLDVDSKPRDKKYKFKLDKVNDSKNPKFRIYFDNDKCLQANLEFKQGNCQQFELKALGGTVNKYGLNLVGTDNYISINWGDNKDIVKLTIGDQERESASFRSRFDFIKVDTPRPVQPPAPQPVQPPVQPLYNQGTGEIRDDILAQIPKLDTIPDKFKTSDLKSAMVWGALNRVRDRDRDRVPGLSRITDEALLKYITNNRIMTNIETNKMEACEFVKTYDGLSTNDHFVTTASRLLQLNAGGGARP